MATILNTGKTLSIRSEPGQDSLFPSVAGDSIFSFGDFRLQRNPSSDNLLSTTGNSSFSNYSTLDSFSSTTFDATSVINTRENELNPKTNDPQSYSYFGSFYTKVASAINNIIDNFPYAILAYDSATASTVFNYSNDLFLNTSSLRVPLSALTNQGNVIFASGITSASTVIGLYNDPQQFGIQLSGNSANTHTYNILEYSYTTGTSGYLQFKLEGFLFTGTSTTSSVVPLYIRPTPQRYGAYKKTISNLEHQLLFEQTFLIPEAETGTFVNTTFEWPKTRDGFNPDSFGNSFDDYSESILSSAQQVDEVKTDWMVRTMIPENFLELDSDGQIYRKLVSVYAEEFDRLKQYIDSIAFAHTVTYNNQENVPDKFVGKLSNLLGLKFTNSFEDVDIFEYLALEDDDEKTFSDYNLELWKKILININWIYKKKGTRDALMFIFKLIGAPDCLINFNEFAYRVNKTVFSDLKTSGKINENGYINYDASGFVFQEGGEGRGNGQNYINQWEPEFVLEKYIDNEKVVTGRTEVDGSADILNTKEIDLNISPASAIECDAKDWFDFGYGTWLWGSTGTTLSPYSVLPLTGITVPFEWLIENVYGVTPDTITGMTISEWIDFIYASNVDPRTRKTEGEGHTGIYINLKKIYITYMLWTNGQPSNRLTFRKLEKFLDLIERNFYGYIPQLLPATTIYDGATVYRNTVFNRQKFVYPEGINVGSEFQTQLPFQGEVSVLPVKITPAINDFTQPEINVFSITSTANDTLTDTINSFSMSQSIDSGISPSTSGFGVESFIKEEESLNVLLTKKFSGSIITFPTPTTIVTADTSN